MKKYNKICLVLGILVVLFGILLINEITYDNNIYIDVSEQKEIKNLENIALMIETGNQTNTYEVSNRGEWPTDGYVFNSSLSRCINGGEISWDNTNKIVLLSGNNADKCYVYFDVYDVAPVINDVSITSISDNDNGNTKIDIDVTKGSRDIKAYYYSIDNGANYIKYDSASHIFTMAVSGTFDFSFYVEDTNGVKSNVFNKSYTYSDLGVYISRATFLTVDGETIESSQLTADYISLKNTLIPKENESGYITLLIVEVVFKDIVEVNFSLHTPGVKSGEEIVVKQYNSEVWETVTSKVIGDNEVQISLTQPGVVAIYKKIT